MHETTDQVRRYAQRMKRERKANSSVARLGSWATTPFVILRIGLVAMYAISVYVATMALIAGVPVFDEAGRTPSGFSTAWGVGLLVTAAIATLCVSFDDPVLSRRTIWRWAELASSGMTWVLTGTYTISLHIVAYDTGDQGRQVVAAVALGLFVIPFLRFLQLASQLGRKPVDLEEPGAEQ